MTEQYIFFYLNFPGSPFCLCLFVPTHTARYLLTCGKGKPCFLFFWANNVQNHPQSFSSNYKRYVLSQMQTDNNLNDSLFLTDYFDCYINQQCTGASNVHMSERNPVFHCGLCWNGTECSEPVTLKSLQQ